MSLHNALTSWHQTNNRSTSKAPPGASGTSLSSSPPKRKPVLIWVLEHQYTESNLSWQHLKGNDRSIAQLLKAYNSSAHVPFGQRLQLRLQMIHRTQTGSSNNDHADEDEDFDGDTEDAFRLTGLPLNEDDIKCNEPNFTKWSIELDDLLPSKTPNPVMTAEPTGGSAEPTGTHGHEYTIPWYAHDRCVWVG
jgi:hypothetical protein